MIIIQSFKNINIPKIIYAHMELSAHLKPTWVYLLNFFADLPLRQVVGEECVAFMLNWRENDYLTLQVPPSLVMNNPYIKVIFLFMIVLMVNALLQSVKCVLTFSAIKKA